MSDNEMEDCEYCGDGIPKHQMAAHIAWCKPLIEKNRALRENKETEKVE